MKARTHWKRSPSPRPINRAGLLTPEEQECARVALAVLKVRLGSYAKVGAAMRLHEKAVQRAASRRCRFTIGMALEVARLAGVSIDDVITGRFPAPGACPMCGRAQSE